MSTEAGLGWAQSLEEAWLSRGVIARALLPLSGVFAATSALRRTLFSLGIARTHAVASPVVVVGNLVAGGAGKTPCVMAIVELLRARGFVPGIVSRGYGRRSGEVIEVTPGLSALACGDEPLLAHLRTRAPVMVGRNRVQAAQRLLLQHPEVDVIVSDDGLQHLALARDAQVLVFDERGAGNGWLLPAGPLREAMPRAAPPRTLVVYNAATPSTPLPGTIARRALGGATPLADWWRGGMPSESALDALRGRRVAAVAGLARPQRFFQMLRDRGLTITTHALPDHHAYASLPWPSNEEDVVITEKDAVKIDPRRIGPARVWVARLDFRFDPLFEAALLDLLPSPRHGNSPP